MTLTKKINGVRVELTPEEEAEVRAEWAKNDSLPRKLPIDQQVSEKFSALPKDSRKRLRKFITEGFVALQAQNMVSVMDILEEAAEVVETPEEGQFLQEVQTILGAVE